MQGMPQHLKGRLFHLLLLVSSQCNPCNLRSQQLSPQARNPHNLPFSRNSLRLSRIRTLLLKVSLSSPTLSSSQVRPSSNQTLSSLNRPSAPMAHSPFSPRLPTLMTTLSP